ncbi:MAG: D-alanyl-D-alanine carboxypeptidase [Clostridiales bacterium]|jgi:D-alanyl-D-alanine carboxypeptidase (penicillin-binding protein 5/6)|nr:D-alanyl-D-alanine carboxypeptidase [Clostridiales bacterium]
MNNKRARLFCFLLAAMMICGNFCPTAFAEVYQPGLTIDAKAAILVEPVTGKILFEQNPDERLALASVTKVMTILLIYESVGQDKIKWDDVVSVSDHAASMGGSQIFLEPNEQQTVRDLTKAIVIASANDAAVAMAEFIAGSEESFVSLMNKRAAELGMQNTCFKNACGLDDDGHFSSARDIAIMSRALITKYPEVQDYTTVWQDTITHKTKRGEEEFGLTNTNKLLKWYKGATGLKTGSTGKALYCLSGTAERDGLKLISVILASPSPITRFQEVIKMLDYGFANFKIAEGEAVGTSVGTVKINKGVLEEAEVTVKDMVGTVVEKGSTEALESEIVIEEHMNAPIAEGTKAGEIIYKYKGAEIGRSDLVIKEEIKKARYIDVVEKLRKIWR